MSRVHVSLLARRLRIWRPSDLLSADVAVLVRRTLAIYALLLMAATWRLWTPQHLFPQVPFFWPLAALPAAWQWIGCGGMVTGLTLALAARSSRAGTMGLLVFVLSTAGMVLTDQQRLQPWVYQFVLVALTLALASPRDVLGLLRLLTISFYFHSALTKFDYSFLHTLGQQFLEALAALVGLSLATWSETSRVAAALVFPAGELLVALLLCVPRWRRAGVIGAVAMHVLLIGALGPWGLNHKPGVLIWNVYFIVQDIVLFWQFGAQSRKLQTKRSQSLTDTMPLAWTGWLARVIVVLSALLPFLVTSGWFDMWPSWGLYASSAERARLVVHRRELEQLPDALLRHVEQPSDAADPWTVLRLDRWCLDALAAPIYPQNRTQLGVAEAVIARWNLGNRARVVRFSQAARLSGERQYDELDGPPQIALAAQDYFFNTRPHQDLFSGQR